VSGFLTISRSIDHSRQTVSALAFLYHFSVHGLAERLLKTIRKQELIKAGDRLAVAASGGADSTALLLFDGGSAV